MSNTGKSLKELGVKVGDVVDFEDCTGKKERMEIKIIDGDLCAANERFSQSVKTSTAILWHLVSRATNYNDGKWHGWNGGECPVHPETVVTCMWQDKDGFFDGDTGKARLFAWHDLDAFRVVKENKEPREFWICAATYETFTNKPAYGKYIHVREVIE